MMVGRTYFQTYAVSTPIILYYRCILFCTYLIHLMSVYYASRIHVQIFNSDRSGTIDFVSNNNIMFGIYQSGFLHKSM